MGAAQHLKNKKNCKRLTEGLQGSLKGEKKASAPKDPAD